MIVGTMYVGIGSSFSVWLVGYNTSYRGICGLHNMHMCLIKDRMYIN